MRKFPVPFAVFVTICLVYFGHVLAKECKYTLSDEIGGGNFDAFGDRLEKLTFNPGNVIYKCGNEDDKHYSYDNRSDIVWSARYTLYNEFQPNIDECLCEKDNDDDFNDCMETLRMNMLDKLHAMWEKYLTDEVVKIACTKLQKSIKDIEAM